MKYLAPLKHDFAKRFFLSYYSCETKAGYDPTPMFTYFVTFINNVLKPQVPISDSIENF